MRYSFRDMDDETLVSENPLPGYSRPDDFSSGYIQNPLNVQETILHDLELEKMRIREQLVVASNAHKLVMEAGLRIELLLERQMAFVRGAHIPFISGSTMTRYDTRLSNTFPCGVKSVKDRLGPRSGIKENENLPLIRSSGPTLIETNPTTEFSNKKFKAILPAKAQDTFSGAKRKAETPPPEVRGVSDIPSTDAKKNGEKEWNCWIGKANFSTVQMLNDHVQEGEHGAAFKRFRPVSEEDNNAVKIVKVNGDREFEQTADESKKEFEKELTSQATLIIDDSKENGNSAVQMLKLTNGSEKFMTLSGADHEHVINDNKNREKYSGEFVEVAQNGGLFAKKNGRETNTSSEIPVTNDVYNLEKSTHDLRKESGFLPANLVKTRDGNAYDSVACHNDCPLQAKPQKNLTVAKRKAETQPLEVVGVSRIPSAHIQGERHKAEEVRKKLGEEMKHKSAEKRERCGTGLVLKDNNKRVKISENQNLEQVIQNSEELKKLTGKKNESAESRTHIIDKSKKGNGNSAVQMLKLAKTDEKFVSPSTSQNGGSQVGKAFTVEQETTKKSGTKDKDIHKLDQAKPVGNVSGSKHKADTQPLEVVGASNIPSAGAKKNLKQIFSCELCQVFVSNKVMLNAHLQGRRHKAAERREKLVIGSVSSKAIPPRIRLMYSNSVQNDEVIQNSEFDKEIKENHESTAEGATRKFVWQRENEKTVDGHQKKQKQLVEFREVAQNGGSQVEKIFMEGQGTTKVSSEIAGTKDKDNDKLKQVVQYADESKNRTKDENDPALQMIQSTYHLEEDNPFFMEKMLKNGDVDANLKNVNDIGYVSARTEVVANGNNWGKEKLEMLLEDSQSGLPAVVHSMEKETNSISFKMLRATNNCTSKQAMSQGNISGAKHKSKRKIPSVGTEKKVKQVFTCELCHVVVLDKRVFDQHIQGMRHKANVEAGRREWFTVKIAQAIIGLYSEQMNEIRNADDLRGETGERDASTFQATENIDNMKTKNGILALEMVKLTNNTEKYEPGPTICKLGDYHKKGMNDYLEANINSGKLLEVTHNGGSQAEKASTVEQETNKVSTNIGGTKVDLMLEQVTLRVDELKETMDKNDLALQVAQSAIDSKTENGNLVDIIPKLDGCKNFKDSFDMIKLGSHTEKMIDGQGKAELHLREFLEVGSNCEFQSEETTFMETETNSGTNNNGNSLQNCDESEQEAKREREPQVIENTCKSEKETNKLTEITLKTGDRNKTYKFKCKICKVGSNTERVMIAHNSKRRHLEKLRKLAENGVPVCVEKAENGVPEKEKEKKQQCEGSSSERL